MNLIAIGLDIAKNVFQVHGVDIHGKAVRRQLRRGIYLCSPILNPKVKTPLATAGGVHIPVDVDAATAVDHVPLFVELDMYGA